MQVTEILKKDLIKDFKSENKLKSAIKKFEIYKFSNYNINQVFKIFNLNPQDIFTETNSRKHLVKIFDMVRSNFFSLKTHNYLNVFFNPTNEVKILKKRAKVLSKLNIEIDDIEKVKNLIKELDDLKLKVVFNSKIIVFDKLLESVLYDKYKVNAECFTKAELEEYFSNSNENNLIIVSEEDLYVEVPVYNLKEFEKLIFGNIIKFNKVEILKVIEILSSISNVDLIKDNLYEMFDSKFNFDCDLESLKEILEENFEEIMKDVTNKTLMLETDIASINVEIKEIISKKQLSLQGDELLELLNSGDMSSLQEKFRADTKSLIVMKEKELIEYYKKYGVKIDYIFSNNDYPLTLDEEIKDEILKKIDIISTEAEFKYYSKLGKFNFSHIKEIFNFVYFLDLLQGVLNFSNKYNLKYCSFGEEMNLISGKNIYIDNPNPVNYFVGSKGIENNLKSEKVCILTGANSGGKTTLLEMILQMQVLSCMGFGVSLDNSSSIKLFDEVVYLKKFTGTQGSGAFEQTIRNLIEILDSKSSKLILIDEFEAVTEPGAAARILIMFLKEIIEGNNFCVGASHLGEEIIKFIEEEKIEGIRIDGISAEGLDTKGNLITNHQPQFYSLGKSTPELILKRILQDTKFWKGKSEDSRRVLEKIVN